MFLMNSSLEAMAPPVGEVTRIGLDTEEGGEGDPMKVS